MNNMELVEALCDICREMADVIVEQESMLLQYNALDLEDNIADLKERYTRIIGPGSWPKESWEDD